MSETDVQRQLEELRQQVASLAAQRATTERVDAPTPDEAADEGAAEPNHAPFEQIEDLVHLLEKELRESPVVSGLAIFAAGVLVGRMLR